MWTLEWNQVVRCKIVSHPEAIIVIVAFVHDHFVWNAEVMILIVSSSTLHLP